ncbi:MAG: excinuclease ABC subunit UvrC [Planctomycetes bacterium]|nr:excinuclease ABC subunit UvrC [Planctomycetota bacterium]MCP4772481.1 excinuclease ABC subunit UvrC [Planctomycetota bacterium]MCP4860126.1 excinuclease ABC subunit UvrC [Planctomycetota bacterium]
MSRDSRSFEEQLKTAPARPGVYLFFDLNQKILYIGKAINLRKRVQVYRREGADGRARLKELLRIAHSAEFRVTDSEKEAILLEERLVKLHQPPLNVLLKDDKSFLWVSLDTTHQWPRLGLARKRSSKGEFFGPYPNASAARRAKRLLQGAFGIRDCSDHTLANRSRACLKYGIHMCSAPCVDKVEASDYAAALDGAREVLQGKVKERLHNEQEHMLNASAKQEYEIALRARDRIKALEALAEPQKVRLDADTDFDVLGVDERGYFALLQYRDGEWLHTRKGHLPLAEDPAAAVSQLLVALYRDDAELVPEVLVGAMPEEQQGLEQWLSSRAGRKVKLIAPQRGPKRALVRMAESNARAQSGAVAGAAWSEVARRISEILHIPAPAIVDCIDVSHLQGQERVASKVRFSEGRPARGFYRRYLVADGTGNDDFAAMREVVQRVLARADEEGLPDLLILDGGRGQLSSGIESLIASGLDLHIVALAKARRGRGPVAAEERLFVPGRDQPIILERGTPERLFCERIRDEAHRFAIGYHRSRRENLRLVLEQVTGIGATKRKILLDHCAGDLGKLRDADPQELTALPGITSELASALQTHLKRIMP